MDKLENIINLPSEVLVKIVKFVPNKTPLKLVCKYFYEIICHIEVKTSRIKIYDDGHDYVRRLQR